uniref:LacI family transcriptional regulator n=1 Tax=Anaerolinea thermolimosa TaxID=229919 RepID=A0A7C4KIM0_9CHLR
MQQRKPTQFDVARIAGVSQTTVSLVLNNPDTQSVPPETRAKVLEAIRQLGYIPNSAARTLRTTRTHTLACIIPSITNPFYPAFVSGVQNTAEENGYEIIIYNTQADANREAKVINLARQGRADGVVGVFFHLHARDLQSLFEQNIAVARLEVRRHSVGELPLDNIFVDNQAAARDATTYLLRKGHRRLAMITGFFGPREARREGFLQALRLMDEPLKSDIIEVETYDERGGYEGVQRLLHQDPNSRPTAIFAANDLMAIGAMKAIREFGFHVPGEISVIGFDDIPAASLVTPALTTIRQFQHEMGARAAQLVIDRLNGNAPAGGRVVEMPYELVVRESA